MGAYLVIKRPDHLLDAGIRNSRSTLLSKGVQAFHDETEYQRASCFPAKPSVGCTVCDCASKQLEFFQKPCSASNCPPENKSISVVNQQWRDQMLPSPI